MAQNYFYNSRPRNGDLLLVKLTYHKTTDVIITFQCKILGYVILQSWQNKLPFIEHLVILGTEQLDIKFNK